MKRIQDVVIRGLEGKPLRVADRQATPDEHGGLPLKEMTCKDAIIVLMFNIPGDRFTRQDAVHSHRLYNQLHPKEEKDGFLELEEAEHDWLRDKLKDDHIGARLFGVNLISIEEALAPRQEQKQG